jgi:hypothetical protein
MSPSLLNVQTKLISSRYMGLLRNQTPRAQTRRAQAQLRLVQSQHLHPPNNQHQPNSPNLLQPHAPTNPNPRPERLPRNPKRPLLALRPHPRRNYQTTRCRRLVNPRPRPRSRKGRETPGTTTTQLPPPPRHRPTRNPRHRITRRRRENHRTNPQTPPALLA